MKPKLTLFRGNSWLPPFAANLDRANRHGLIWQLIGTPRYIAHFLRVATLEGFGFTVLTTLKEQALNGRTFRNLEEVSACYHRVQGLLQSSLAS